MGRLTPALAAGLSLWAAAAATHAFELVSEQEAQQSRAAAVQPVARSPLPPGAPAIKLLAPDTAATVSSPTRIELRFEPGPQASIRPETFKVLYGAFKVDITKRITERSQVNAQGIQVTQAHLPKGSHRLIVEIQDSAGRVGERMISFVVD